MAINIYTDGSADDKFTTTANWSLGVLPADEDTIVFNDQSAGPCNLECDAANIGAKAFYVIVDKTMKYPVGSAAVKFGGSGDAGTDRVFHTLYFAGSSLTPSYFDTAAAKTSDRVVIDTQNAKDDSVILSGSGSWGDVILRNGKPKIDTTTITGRIKLFAGAGNAKTELNIPAGSTLTGSETTVFGGILNCSTAIPQVTVLGGEFILDGSVGIATRLDMHGGTTYWDASASTIALVDLFGGMLKTRKDRAGRVLTNMNVHGSGLADFMIGGRNITFTNPPRIFGENPIRMPQAMTVTFGA